MDESDQPHGFQRLLFFSDAVFAIAITVLVLDVRLPEGARSFNLMNVGPEMLGFAITFYAIGRFWLVHHALFEGVRGYDRRVLRANLAFLAVIVFLPFPTSVVARLPPSSATVGFYGLSLAAVGVLMMLLTWIARRPALLRPGETFGGTIRRLTNTGVVTLVFALTALVGQAWPNIAMLTLLLLFPASWAADRLGHRLEARIDGAALPRADVTTP